MQRAPKAASRVLVQVDVEGFEPHVLKSATGLLLGSKVDNLVMEYSPGVAERHQNWDLFEANPSMLVRWVLSFLFAHLKGLGIVLKPTPPCSSGRWCVSSYNQTTGCRVRLKLQFEESLAVCFCRGLRVALIPSSR